MGQKRFVRIFAAKLLQEFNECQPRFQAYLDLMAQSKAATPQPIYGVRGNPLIRSRD